MRGYTWSVTRYKETVMEWLGLGILHSLARDWILCKKKGDQKTVFALHLISECIRMQVA